ncbi:hypothetical protein [Candidatus Neptunichlamydia sp. REUL1]|uniref:hypothetical protein n=1 Tax=Candidatus Neptunichlamydia sp. REUL1 TaxID=3064277 RepID=UPI00293197D4|nr:hypothetical protein [Candidatus Neptunochlamydia sp. REUL1]
MKRVIFYFGIFLLTSISLFSETVNFSEIKVEEKIKNKGSRGNFLGPSVQAQLSHDFNLGVVSGLFEGGPKQLRSSAALEFCLGSNRGTGIKISTEHLMQDLKFNFHTSSQKKWVHQASAGIGFKHVLENERHPLFIKSFQIDGCYSHSWSKNLDKKYIGHHKNCISFRRIAGVNLWGGSGGVDLQFKKFRSILGLIVNYDYLKFDIKNSYQLSKSGFGGGFSLLQPLSDAFDLKAKISFRKSFNKYSGEFNWNPNKIPGLAAGLFGGYTSGKYGLASSYDIGIKLSYLFGHKKSESSHSKNLLSGYSASKNCFKTCIQDSFIRMPQVIAVSDEKISCSLILSEKVLSCDGLFFAPIVFQRDNQNPNPNIASVDYYIKNFDKTKSTGKIDIDFKLVDGDIITPSYQTSQKIYFQDVDPKGFLNQGLDPESTGSLIINFNNAGLKYDDVSQWECKFENQVCGEVDQLVNEPS